MPDEDKSYIDRGLIDRANIVLRKPTANQLTLVTVESCPAGIDFSGTLASARR